MDGRPLVPASNIISTKQIGTVCTPSRPPGTEHTQPCPVNCCIYDSPLRLYAYSITVRSSRVLSRGARSLFFFDSSSVTRFLFSFLFFSFSSPSSCFFIEFTFNSSFRLLFSSSLLTLLFSSQPCSSPHLPLQAKLFSLFFSLVYLFLQLLPSFASVLYLPSLNCYCLNFSTYRHVFLYHLQRP